MVENYEYLDNRFRSVPFSKGGPHHSEALSAHIVVMMELFVMIPLCLVCFVGVLSQKKWAQEAEICLCVIHIMGTTFFSIPPLVDHCIGLAPIGQVGCFPSVFSLFNLFYYYFAFGINLLWIAVPAMYIYQAVASNYSLKLQAPTTNEKAGKSQ